MSRAPRISGLPESNFPAIFLCPGFLCAGALITAVGQDRLDVKRGLDHGES